MVTDQDSVGSHLVVFSRLLLVAGGGNGDIKDYPTIVVRKLHFLSTLDGL